MSGLILGSLYAAMAMGLTILYGVVHIFNFAHGIFAVLGGYIVWAFLTLLGVPVLPSIILSMVIMFSLGWVLFKATINPLLKKPNWEFSTIIFTMGLGILLENVTLQIFGPRFKVIPPFFGGRLRVGFLQISWHEVTLILAVVVFIVALNLFLKKTWFGQAMRAVAQNMEGARTVGINLYRTFGNAFALATAVTALSGILLATKYPVIPQISWSWMVTGFAIIVLGGLGSPTGAVIAAFVLGLAEATTVLYLGSLWIMPLWFIVFLVILLVRPQGLGGGRSL